MAKAFLGVRATANIPSSPTDDGRTPSTTEDPAVIDSRTAQMQAILDTEGTLHLKDGVYVIGQLVVSDSNVVMGESIERTILWAQNGLNDTLIVSENLDELVGGLLNQPGQTANGAWPKYHELQPFQCAVLNIKLDGNKENNTSGGGINFYCQRPHINNVAVTHMAGDGVTISRGNESHDEYGNWVGSPEDKRTVCDVSDALILSVNYCEGIGLLFSRGNDFVTDNLVISNNKAGGIKVTSDAGAITICGHVWSCGETDDKPGVLLEGSANIKFLYTDSNYGCGLEVAALACRCSQLKIIGSRADYDGPTVLVSEPDFVCTNISGNILTNRIGIKITNGGYRTQITGIDLWGPSGDNTCNLIESSANQVRLEGILRSANVACYVGKDGKDDGCDVDISVQDAITAFRGQLGNANRVYLKYVASTVTNPVTYGSASTVLSGTVTSSHATVMTDSEASFVPNDLVGLTINNTTDGSAGIIVANTETTVTATLIGGTANAWVADTDGYSIDTNTVTTRGI